MITTSFSTTALASSDAVFAEVSSSRTWISVSDIEGDLVLKDNAWFALSAILLTFVC